jgi:protein-disulfide isomerase
MPSGKQSKRRRAAAAAAPPQARRRQASPRVLIGALAGVVVIAIGIVVAVVVSGGSSDSSSSANATTLPSAGDAQRLLAGIPQHGTVLGKPSAPVTMTEWIDLQCPYCQQFETQALPVLIRKYVRTGKLKIDARLIGFLGPDSHRGRLAALAAGKQNKLFNLAELLYYNQGPENTGWLNDDLLASAAASIPGLDAERMLSERNSAQTGNEANALDAQAQEQGVNSTPTILVGKTGKQPKLVTITSPTDSATIARAIDDALKG